MDADAQTKNFGRLTVAASWLALFCLFGYRATFGMLKGNMSLDLGWTAAQTTMGYSIMMVVYAITAFFSGAIIDKWGTRPAFACGAFFGFLGFFVTSKVDSLTAYYFTFGVLGGIATGMLWVSSTVSVRKWYIGANYAKMFGLAFMGAPMAQVLMSLVVKWVVTGGAPDSWRSAMNILGFVVLVALIAAAALARKAPEAYGLKPIGGQAQPGSGPALEAPASISYPWKRAEAFKTYPMWAAILVFLTAMLGEFLIWTQVISYWGKDVGIHLADATNMYILIGIVGIFSMPLVGMASDGLVKKLGNEPKGRKTALIIGPVIGLVACACLLLQPHNLNLGYLACVLFAVYWAVVPGGVVGYCGSVFGRATLGSIWGLATLIIMGIGPFLGSYIGAALADYHQSYTNSIIFAACAFIACGILTASTLPLSVKLPAKEEDGVLTSSIPNSV